MNILNFISTHCSDAVVVFVGILALLYFVFIMKNHRAFLKNAALELVARAEKEYGGKTGDIKYATVAAELYKRIPLMFRPFVSEALLGDIIGVAVKKLQQALFEGATLDSYFVENYIEGADPGSLNSDGD